MNKTKRRIFNSALKLFAENGYSATTIEEITSSTGVAKATLYYHFKSKEEIYNFLVNEGINLLINSVQIKTNKFEDYDDKIKAILLIQSKIIFEYSYLIKILFSDMWGNGEFNKKCKVEVSRYLIEIENVIQKGIEEKQIECEDSQYLASQIYSLICSGILYKDLNENATPAELYKYFEKSIFDKVKVKKKKRIKNINERKNT